MKLEPQRAMPVYLDFLCHAEERSISEKCEPLICTKTVFIALANRSFTFGKG